MFGLFKKKPAAKTTTTEPPPSLPVLPIVQPMARIDAVRAHFAAKYPAGPDRDARLPLIQPLAGDLCIAYTTDHAEFAKLLLERDLPALGIPRIDLHDTAVRNLRRHVQGKLTINQTKELFLIAGLRGLEASLLAVPEVWDGIGAQGDGEVLAAVPFGGIVIACVQPPLNAARDRKAIGRRAKETFLVECREALRTAGDKLLSRHAFAWRDGRWMSLGVIGDEGIEPDLGARRDDEPGGDTLRASLRHAETQHGGTTQLAATTLKATYKCPGCGGETFVKADGIHQADSLKCEGCGAVIAIEEVEAAVGKDAVRLGADGVGMDVVRR